jgi:hypothetical protein
MSRMLSRGEVPLHENGTAPRILVTDIERLESLGDGLYCFVCTHPLEIGGAMHRDVVVYIDATPWAIAKGIVLSVAIVKELSVFMDKVKSVFTFH